MIWYYITIQSPSSPSPNLRLWRCRCNRHPRGREDDATGQAAGATATVGGLAMRCRRWGRNEKMGQGPGESNMIWEDLTLNKWDFT